MTLTRGFIRDAATQPVDARLMDLARVVTNSDGTARTGVLGVLPGNLLIALGSMNVTVVAATFATSRAKSDGVAIFANDGNVNVPISAAPVSNSRITAIWVKHNDNTQGDANALPIFGTTDGAAAASPTKPAIPTGALELGTLRVYSGTTAANGGLNVLTQTYAMTTTQGGVVPFRTAADLALWTNPSDGQWATVLDDNSGNSFYGWTGTAWKRSSNVIGKSSSAPASQTGIAAADVAITGLSVATTNPRVGDVRVTILVQTYASTADVLIVVRLKDGATIVGEAVRAANSSVNSAATSVYQLVVFYLSAVTAGAHNYSVALARVAGAGTAQTFPAALSPTTIVVETID